MAAEVSSFNTFDSGIYLVCGFVGTHTLPHNAKAQGLHGRQTFAL